ncbi:hypothetical protein INR49_016085 [Caranx melampygus]|nr:hypothetical protein INR49_016085 [Caranx melampygus]
MIWSIGSNPVLTFLHETSSSVSSSDQYSAMLCSAGDKNCVVFTIHNVNRSLSGEVECAIQTGFEIKKAQLYVQGNLTVQQDQEVELRCVMTAWFPAPDVSWSRNGQAVNSSLFNTTSVEDGDYMNSTSVLKFQAVSNTTVECEATILKLENPQSSSIFLVVVPKPTDWTVLIAVVVSFGSFALLVLLIIGAIFCYRRRKDRQPNYQDEMRRVRTQSQLSGTRPAAQRQGRMNAGYEPEGQTSVAPSELTDSGFSQMPDVVSSVEAGNGYNSAHNTVDDFGFPKHRHVTIV